MCFCKVILLVHVNHIKCDILNKIRGYKYIALLKYSKGHWDVSHVKTQVELTPGGVKVFWGSYSLTFLFLENFSFSKITKRFCTKISTKSWKDEKQN